MVKTQTPSTEATCLPTTDLPLFPFSHDHFCLWGTHNSCWLRELPLPPQACQIRRFNNLWTHFGQDRKHTLPSCLCSPERKTIFPPFLHIWQMVPPSSPPCGVWRRRLAFGVTPGWQREEIPGKSSRSGVVRERPPEPRALWWVPCCFFAGLAKLGLTRELSLPGAVSPPANCVGVMESIIRLHLRSLLSGCLMLHLLMASGLGATA